MPAIHCDCGGAILRSVLWLALLGLAATGFAQSRADEGKSCQVATILFGNVELEIVPQQEQESALVRHADFDHAAWIFRAIRGELTVERGGFAIRNRDYVVVGVISPKLEVEGWDDACDTAKAVVIKQVQPHSYVVLNGSTPVGTIKGRFPKNSFGVD